MSFLKMERNMSSPIKSSGFTLIEVLVTVVILAIGLLGLAGLQMTSLNNQLEANQRAQVLLLLEDMSNRIRVNSAWARTPGGYPDGADSGISTEEVCNPNPTSASEIAQRDLCQWNLALMGAGVKLGTKNSGSVIGAIGCIENLAGSGDGDVVVRLTVAWQGMSSTAVPVSDCGKDAFGADDSVRRVASVETVLADLAL
jgi:type IV pilus assembly protein PilV